MNRITTRTSALAATAALCLGLSGCNGAFGFRSDGKREASKLPDEPDVTLTQLQGGSLPLASLKGKVLLVDFWATWCEPCKDEIPWLIEMQQKYAGRGFTVVGIAMDESGKKVVDPFVANTEFDVNGKKELMNYPIMIGNLDVAEKFGGLFGYPTSVLISRNGKIVKRFIGLVSESDIEDAIKSQL
jgi:thiol-disulfide isomerase/thioredoxin